MFKRSDKSGTRLNVLMIILCIALIGGLGAMWYYNHQIQSQRREELKALSKSNTSLERYFPQEGDAGLEEGGIKENADEEDSVEENTMTENPAQGSEHAGNSAQEEEQGGDSTQSAGREEDPAQSAEQAENPDPAQNSSLQAENTGI